jgi:NADH dehydrogenase
MSRPRIVIVGGGFAGVWAAMGAAARLQRERAEEKIAITLISPDGLLVMRPRLYEADLGGTRVPLQPLLDSLGVELRRASVETIDVERRALLLSGDAPGELRYDQLVLCAGSRLTLPPSARELYSADDHAAASALQAAIATLAERPSAAFSATVVGAGFTGVELAAELAGILSDRARRAGGPAPDTPVTLIDAAADVAPEFGPDAREVIHGALTGLGVATQTGVAVSRVEQDGVLLADGHLIRSDLTVWACGPHASALNGQLGPQLDECGRITVDRHLAAELDGVFVAGDCARATVDGRQLAPMSCQHAIPQGRQAGENAVAALLGRPLGEYRQPLYIACLDLGAAGALVTRGFDRNRILATGEQGKRFKRFINRSRIYPPAGRDRAKLLRAGRAAPAGRAAAAIQGLALRSAAVRGRVTSHGEDRAESY